DAGEAPGQAPFLPLQPVDRQRLLPRRLHRVLGPGHPEDPARMPRARHRAAGLRLRHGGLVADLPGEPCAPAGGFGGGGPNRRLDYPNHYPNRRPDYPNRRPDYPNPIGFPDLGEPRDVTAGTGRCTGIDPRWHQVPPQQDEARWCDPSCGAFKRWPLGGREMTLSLLTQAGMLPTAQALACASSRVAISSR